MQKSQRNSPVSFNHLASGNMSEGVGGGHEVILVTAGYDHTIRFWEALNGVCHRTLQHPDSQVNRMVIFPDRRLLAVAGSGNPNPITSFEGHTANVTGIAVNQYCTWLASSSEDSTIKVWDIRAPGLQRNYDHRAPVNDVCAHPNQGELVSCDQSGSIRIWDLTENTCSHELVPEEDSAVRSLAISSDGSALVAGNHKGNVFVWKMPGAVDFNDIQPALRFSAHKRHITRLALSHDPFNNQLYLATCSADHPVKLWDINQNESVLKRTLEGHQRWVWDCAFSADSAYLVTASSDHTARLWDLSSGETIRQYNGHQKAVVCVALNDLSSTVAASAGATN